ncbi:MAG TPA: LacI family DNA-binding transcriptional regulator [Solirubrobacteraceae bacterium]|nr:LacI family DNA-binding transcriptional regulator [Solirubrobacteraceae bacterium]
MRSQEESRGPARATMVDVARVAGVSLKTVSRAINGEPGVSQATLEKVRAAAAHLRYERNDLAASLRHGDRSNTLGLVIEDVANPFYAAIAKAVEDSVRGRQCLLITASAGEDPALEREIVTALLRRRVDAVLIVPAGTDHRYLEANGLARRAVFLDRPPARVDADAVLVANAPGARLAVEHLLAAGHRRIAFIGDDRRLFTARERLGGYRAALQAAGVPADPELVSMGNSTSRSAYEAITRALALPRGRRPTAVLAGNNRCTIGVLEGLGARRRRLALVGFDDFELAELLEVTVVRTDPYRIGTIAAELALSRIDGDHAGPRRVVLDVELVARGSGELPA